MCIYEYILNIELLKLPHKNIAGLPRSSELYLEKSRFV